MRGSGARGDAEIDNDVLSHNTAALGCLLVKLY